MPVDQHGIRADLVKAPDSPIRRMNEGTRWEPAINRISEMVRRKMEALYKAGKPLEAWDTYIDWLNDIDPAYAELVAQTRRTSEQRIASVVECIKDKIYLKITPSTNTMTPENLLKWRDKWGAHPSPVTFVKTNHDGSDPRVFTTTDPVLIGREYIWTLCKIPTATSSGPSFVSHFGVPIKPSGAARDRYVTAMTPVRGGEDETRLFLMEGNPEEAIRYKTLMADSPTGIKRLVEQQILDPHPTRIKRVPITNEELLRTSAPMDLFAHTMASLGIESRRTATHRRIEDYSNGEDAALVAVDESAALPAPEEGDRRGVSDDSTTLDLLEEVDDLAEGEAE